MTIMSSQDEPKWIMVMHQKDNVGVCLRQTDANVSLKIGDQDLKTVSSIPLGHKIALSDLSPGDDVVKYGEIIGRAKKPIKRGEHVHDHNIKDY
jgi:altronate dehydratase